MDSVAASRRNNKKGNKENAQPAYGSKTFIKSDKMSAAPFQLKNNKNEETVVKNGNLKAKAKQADTKLTSGEVLKKIKTVQRDGQGATATEKRKMHTQAFLNEQVAKDKKTVAEVPKLLASVPSSKPAPGMYKGKIVQSKIGSIWKSSATVGGTEPQSGLKPESQKVGNVTKIRSKSVADLPGQGTQRPAPTRSKSVVDKPAPVSKSAFKSRPPAGFISSRPPATTVPATITSNRNTNMVLTKRNGISSSRTKMPGTDKVNKRPVSSTISQYRLNMETTEERRAKLADWLASKGKTLKRPAMTAGPSKTKVSAKPEPDLKPHPVHNPEPAPHVEAHEPDSADAHCADTQRAELAHSQTPVIRDTTLDLLKISDADLPVVPQDSLDDIVVNLCDALEAMATPSRCDDELSQGTDACNNVEVEDNKPKDECEMEQMENGMQEDVSKHLQVEQVKEEVEESDEEGQNEDDRVMETTPQMGDASVVKYSVKTTPYLQSVKKTIEDDVSTSASRRKSNIKDFKFLTPVRRSNRIQQKSSHLPTMLLDHDPCVTSLAELVKLDDNPNAYIYRKNPALVEDQHSM